MARSNHPPLPPPKDTNYRIKKASPPLLGIVAPEGENSDPCIHPSAPSESFIIHDSGEDGFSSSASNPSAHRHSRLSWWNLPRELWSIMAMRSRKPKQSYEGAEEDEGLLQGGGDGTGTVNRNGEWAAPHGWKQLSVRRKFEVLLLYTIALPLIFWNVYNFSNLLSPNNIEADPLADWGKPDTTSEGLSWYPTNFLRDVIPIACHSHNDYWRKVPLFSALYAGCISTEADVWDFGGSDLFVGHNNAALTANRTFLSLYVNPLVGILERQNPSTEFYNGTSHGVFDTDHEQGLTLLVDVKTDGKKTWLKVLEQLEPLRKRGWLTFVENGVLNKRPITVVGTGETPFDVLTRNTTYRDAFFDAYLGTMWKDPPNQPSDPHPSKDSSPFESNLIKSQSNPTSGQGNSGTSATDDYNPQNSYYASASFFDLIGIPWRFGSLSEKQLYKIRGLVAGAHEKGLKVRFWDTPSWPRSLRQGIWRVLVDEGVDILNVDDLEAARSGHW